VLRRAAVSAGSPTGSLGEVHVRALEDLVVHWHGQGAAALPGGVSASRDCGRLTLARDRAEATQSQEAPGER
jgi:tRNA(Ile)-lysidine synthase